MPKAATVLVLDTSLTDDAAFNNACEICEKVIVDKMVYASSDEVAVVLAGTQTSRSTLYEKAFHERYEHITVEREMAHASRQSLDSIAAVRQARKGTGPLSKGASCAFDFVETLTVAADVLQARTAGKKYTRAIYFITDARHVVVYKSDLNMLFESLANDRVTLVVIGIDFHSTANESSENGEAQEENTEEPSWDTLDVKTQNERILASLCAALGSPSRVISPAEATHTLSLLHCRRVRQHPILCVILSIGDIRLATQLFTLSQQEKLPTLSRSTHEGADITQSVVYETKVSCADGKAERHAVGSEDLIFCFFFGIDRIPCSATVREKMKVKGERALQAIAFVAETEVEPYVLMGGTRALLPLAGDHPGQRGYNALVEAMEATGKAMLVRLVRAQDAAPVLGVCFVQRCDRVDGDGLPRRLVMAPLPFAEDIRGFQFSEYPEFRFTAAEERQMDNLIDGLSVDGTVLAPHDTFNPVLQHYYATLEAKLMAATAADAMSTPSLQVPSLPAQLQGTSTNFFVKGSVVYECMQKNLRALEACAAHFPYEEDVSGDDEDENNYGARKINTSAKIYGGEKAEECVREDHLRGNEKPSLCLNGESSATENGSLALLEHLQVAGHSVASRSPSTVAAPIWSENQNRDDTPAPRMSSSSPVPSEHPTTTSTLPHNVQEGATAVTPATIITTPVEPIKDSNWTLNQCGEGLAPIR